MLSITDFDRLALELVPLETAALRLLMSRSPGPIETYLSLLDEARTLDIASPAAATFQRRFSTPSMAYAETRPGARASMSSFKSRRRWMPTPESCSRRFLRQCVWRLGG